MSDITYNGWTNYPTWAAYLYIITDPEYTEIVNNRIKAASEPIKAANSLATALRDDIIDAWEARFPDTGMLADICEWAIRHINWEEIALSLITDFSDV